MFDKRQYFRNAVANQGAFVVSVLAALIISPIVVRSLGDETYGYWTLVMSLTSYYSFIDMGIRTAVTQYVARYLVSKDRENLARTLNTAIAVLSVIALVICVVAIAFAAFFPHFFDVESSKWAGVRTAIVICGISMSLRFPTGVFHAVITGNQRWDIFGFVQIGVRLLNAGLVVAVMQAGHGIVALAVVTLACQVAESLVMLYFARGMTLGLPFRFDFDLESFKRMRNFGIYSFIIHLCELAIFYTDNFVVGRTLGPVAVTYFAIGASLIPYMNNLVMGMSAQLQQIAVGYDAKGQNDSMRVLFFDGSRYLFALTCLLFANMAVVGPAFIGVWMGEKYVSGEGFGLAGTVLIVLAAAHVFHNLPTVARQILFGMQKTNLLALTSAIDAAIKLALSLVLVRTHGLVGVAVGTLIPMFLMSGVVVPSMVCRLLSVRVRDFVARAVIPNLLATVLSVGGGVLFTRYSGLTGWFGVIAGSVCASALHALGVWSLVLTPTARVRLIGMIQSRLSRSS